LLQVTFLSLYSFTYNHFTLSNQRFTTIAQKYVCQSPALSAASHLWLFDTALQWMSIACDDALLSSIRSLLTMAPKPRRMEAVVESRLPTGVIFLRFSRKNGNAETDRQCSDLRQGIQTRGWQ
jgi:hypothetical protein